MIELKSNFLSEKSVKRQNESTVVVSNDGLETKLSASQLKHCTSTYYGRKAEQTDNWIITALTGPWENWFRTLVCSRLQLCLLREVKTDSAEPDVWICVGYHCTAGFLFGCHSGPKHPKCNFGRGRLYITRMRGHGST